MNQKTNEISSVEARQIINQIIKSWETQNKIITEFFNKYEEDYYLSEVAPGKNRAIYILGHLIGMNDTLLSMLGFGNKLYPQLESIFVTSPDREVAEIPSIQTLKEYWENLNQTLISHFAQMGVEDWLKRHTKVSEEDFAIDPFRNKLNVLIGRINHESYHSGQLALLNRGKST
jgi:hypothetical protein